MSERFQSLYRRFKAKGYPVLLDGETPEPQGKPKNLFIERFHKYQGW